MRRPVVGLRVLGSPAQLREWTAQARGAIATKLKELGYGE